MFSRLDARAEFETELRLEKNWQDTALMNISDFIRDGTEPRLELELDRA